MLASDGSLDRALLRRRVMGDPESRAALNRMVHPEVQTLRAVREAALEKAGAAIVVHDVPLLFEVLDPSDFDLVVLVDAPAQVRRQRLMVSRGLSRREADELIGAQFPSDGKRARSDFVIDNGGTREALEAAAGGVWRELQRRAGMG
jgi:dephospho-CoA kinase